jgi:hypothetical protein
MNSLSARPPSPVERRLRLPFFPGFRDAFFFGCFLSFFLYGVARLRPHAEMSVFSAALSLVLPVD